MNSILIRAEDKNPWEKRVPLVPKDIKNIITETNSKFFIQNSDLRCFNIDEYKSVGASLSETFHNGDIILGVKEIPESKILENKTYMFFSHTIKGSKSNMPMLKKIMSSNSTLIDYELIKNSSGNRLIYFGNFAGDVGTLDILWLMGEYWEKRGINTPLINCTQAINYKSLSDAKEKMLAIGNLISNDGFPKTLSPIIIGILGYGNVSKGVQRILNCLPHEYLSPENLESLVNNNELKNDKVYIVVFKEENLVENISGKDFSLSDYYENPESFKSVFHKYLPYISILINAIYWDERYPKFVTWDVLQDLYTSNEKTKLSGIADITCDVNGSIECNVESTDIGNPAYVCNPFKKSISYNLKDTGVLLLAVDNLPAELPIDSSEFFSNQLKEFIPNLINADFSKELESSGLVDELKDAVIVYKGKLTPKYEYLREYL